MTEDRNTPRDIVFDLEDDIAAIRRHKDLLLIIAQDSGLDDVMQGALTQLAYGLSDAHRDLHDKFSRLFDQIVRAGDDKPEPEGDAPAD